MGARHHSAGGRRRRDFIMLLGIAAGEAEPSFNVIETKFLHASPRFRPRNHPTKGVFRTLIATELARRQSQNGPPGVLSW
jgi:hypothetical protein